jgi:hypothetical protein
MNDALSRHSATEIENVSTTIVIFEMDAEVADAHGTAKDASVRHGPAKVVTVDNTFSSLASQGLRWNP